jgi:hypothetical protein
VTVFQDSALAYAEQDGLYILPLKPREKVPLTPNGLDDATTDLMTIETWWHRWPEANVGIRTGPIVVVDEDRLNALQELADSHGETIPPTRVAKTGSGRHYYFTQPAGTRIRNTAGKLAPGIDTRGDGGYVVAPPSVHPNGGHYEWESEQQPAPLPEWIARLLHKPEPVRRDPAPLRIAGDTTPYAQRALEDETSAVAAAPEGTRNDRLNTAAFSLGQLVAGGELSERDAIAALEDAASACGLPEREAAATIRSGLTSGMDNPRTAPERPLALVPARLNGSAPHQAAEPGVEAPSLIRIVTLDEFVSVTEDTADPAHRRPRRQPPTRRRAPAHVRRRRRRQNDALDRRARPPRLRHLARQPVPKPANGRS